MGCGGITDDVEKFALHLGCISWDYKMGNIQKAIENCH
jgi:hypothetical protein